MSGSMGAGMGGGQISPLALALMGQMGGSQGDPTGGQMGQSQMPDIGSLGMLGAIGAINAGNQSQNPAMPGGVSPWVLQASGVLGQ